MRLALAASLATLSLTGSASPAGASVTIGQLPTNPIGSCSADQDRLQAGVVSGSSYVVPETGGVTAWTLTSWSHNAMAGAGQTLTMKVFRKIAEPAAYRVVGHDGPRILSPSTVNTFATTIQVRTGDVLGNNGRALFSASSACRTDSPGDIILDHFPGLADGEEAPFTPQSPDSRLNVMAVIDPVNTFSLGATRSNKKKGTATITATVPNPGKLTASGKGVKASGARVSKDVGAGQVKLTIRAKGKKRKALNETGKVRIKPKITYTPTGGDPSNQSRKLKLLKR